MLFTTITAAIAQSQPPQPSSGPGGSQILYNMRESVYGSGATQFWIFTPQPQPRPAPVVIFMHGYSAIIPAPYEAWIEHIVRRGNIVIYPRYQEDAVDPPAYFTANTISALKSAFEILATTGSADLDHVAMFTHSFGGIVGFNVVARTELTGLPAPKAMFIAHPGSAIWADLELYRQISPSTLVTFVVGEDDNVVGDASAIAMIGALPQISRKNFITVQSDNHGTLPLSSNHFAPNAPPVNALDYLGYWKLSDALMDLAFYGRNGDYALGGGDNQTSLGSWDDGVPVKPLTLRPTLATLDVVNAASLQPGPIAPGEMVSLFGSGLGPKEIQGFQVDGDGRVMRSLAGTRVLFNGIPSPIIYSFMNRVVAIVPYSMSGRESVTVQIEAGGYTSGTVSLRVTSTSPAIFSANGSGTGQGSIVNQTFTANSSRNPAATGSQIMIFATGEGEITSAMSEGTLVTTAAAAAAKPKLPVSLTIGGVPATVTYAGEAPGFFAGVLQVNALLPDLPPGDQPVVLTIGNASSQTGITVAVK